MKALWIATAWLVAGLIPIAIGTILVKAAYVPVGTVYYKLSVADDYFTENMIGILQERPLQYALCPGLFLFSSVIYATALFFVFRRQHKLRLADDSVRCTYAVRRVLILIGSELWLVPIVCFETVRVLFAEPYYTYDPVSTLIWLFPLMALAAIITVIRIGAYDGGAIGAVKNVIVGLVAILACMMIPWWLLGKGLFGNGMAVLDVLSGSYGPWIFGPNWTRM